MRPLLTSLATLLLTAPAALAQDDVPTFVPGPDPRPDDLAGFPSGFVALFVIIGILGVITGFVTMRREWFEGSFFSRSKVNLDDTRPSMPGPPAPAEPRR